MSVDVYVPGASGPNSLREALGLDRGVDEFTLYVAHASYPWLEHYSDDLNLAGKVSARVGLDLLPQGSALAKLRGISLRQGTDIRLIRSLDRATFHPKLYVTRRGNEVRGVLGSSNASTPAFSRSVEANLWIRGAPGSHEDA